MVLGTLPSVVRSMLDAFDLVEDPNISNLNDVFHRALNYSEYHFVLRLSETI